MTRDASGPLDYYDVRDIINRERRELADLASGEPNEKRRHGHNEAWNALTRVLDQITALGVVKGAFDA